ncbi:sigma-70 family RNA polymerase sigma factor [Nocardioides aquiterrae]|uniref:RNA polymerase sigma factor n=1 Tax=Nocardioides aquiterrae TaxID=203799 RepID=A0ABN1U9N9_9ACTN
MDVVDGEADWGRVAGALAPGLLRLAVMLTGSTTDAEDLLQATFARAQRHGRRIAAMAAPAAYLRTVMVNEHVSDRRRRRLRTVPLEHDVPTTAPVEVEHDVWGWLATLPRQQRAALVLRFYEDLPDGEIAAALGCSAATVRSHVSRGLASLRAALVTEETR